MVRLVQSENGGHAAIEKGGLHANNVGVKRRRIFAHVDGEDVQRQRRVPSLLDIDARPLLGGLPN